MKLSAQQWLITQEEFLISSAQETNFTMANGYIGIRGTHEEMLPGEVLGTFVAGLYDQSEAQVSEFVNIPYFWGLRIYINRQYLDPTVCKVLEYKRVLDMKQGLLYKFIRVKDKQGRITKIEGYRFVSIADRNLCPMTYTVTPENYDAILNIESIMNGVVCNTEADPKERVKHFVISKMTDDKDGIYIEAATREKDYKIGIASSLQVLHEGKNAGFNRYARILGEVMTENIEVQVTQGSTYTINKYTALVSSRETAKDNVRPKAKALLDGSIELGIEVLLNKHVQALDQLWNVTDIKIVGDEQADVSLRFNLFHLMSCANEDDERVSIGAKGIHGEGYKGHVFWDTEIFMLPFFIYSNPKAAKTLLMYRYHLLDAARDNAKKNGYKGAQYPWESADTGVEETPRWGVDYVGNPVRIWTGDIEYHITADIAFAIREYIRATDDMEFFLRYGAEMFLETARFWVYRGEYNKEMDRYEINDVIGPDEFHEHCNNNCYTNYLAKWNIERAFEYISMMQEQYPHEYSRLVTKIGLAQEELDFWREVSQKIYIPFNPEDGLMEQFEGYFKLEDKLITEYDENNMPVWPEGINLARLDEYQLLKQADVIMLMHLLGEEFDMETKRINFAYYEKRTMHKSSLSPSLYSLMGVVVGDHSKAYEYFMRTALVDLVDNQGNAWLGLHSASTGGTWQTAVFGFGGMSIDKEGVLAFNPWLPDQWQSMEFTIAWKKRVLGVKITRDSVDVKLKEGESGLPVRLCDQIIML